MLDSIKLCLDGYKITDDLDVDVFQPTVNTKTGELRGHYPLLRSGSDWIRGSKAVCNLEELRVTLKPFTPSEPDHIGCWAEFSVPKVVDGSNYQPADFETTKAAFASVQKQLKTQGIETDILKATISRLDVCKGVLTSQPYQAYAPVLGRLQGTRMATRDYGTTFLWHNGSHEICAYDKIEEMKRRKKNISRLPKNCVRFEYRMLTGRKLNDVLGFRTAADLIEGFDQVKPGYITAMKKQLFRFSPAELEIRTVQDFKEDLLALKRAGKRNYVAEFLLIQGRGVVAQNNEAFITAVEEVSDSRATLGRTKNMLRQAQIDALSLQRESTSKLTHGDLYRELEREVLSK
jgi:hypothetical protein